MSATTLGHKGLEAVKNKDWEAALPLLDKALTSSNSPAWLLARSQTHQQLKNYDAALRDAELAYHTAAERSSGTSRKFMIDAQHRRSVILHRLGRYADADCCAKWSMLLAEGRPAREDDGVEKQVDSNGNYTVTVEDALADKAGQPNYNPMSGLGGPGGDAKASKTERTGFESEWTRAYTWRAQVLGMLKSLPEDHAGRKVTVTKIPTKPEPQKLEPKAEEETVDTSDKNDAEKPSAPAPGSIPDDQLKLRADFYQTNQNVTISLFAKDAKRENVQVQFFNNYVQISSIPRSAAPYVQPGDREAASTLTLGGEIVPSGSRFTVTPRKIELVLQKATPGVKWSTWGAEEIGISAPKAGVSASPVAASPVVAAPEKQAAPASTSPPAASTPKPTGAPAYPTSSRSGAKDWDKLGDDEDDTNKEDINGFFKTLYKGATPDQQRAMMKSFIESNGTALSTDWTDVANRTVETVPPEGVVPKKWKE